MATAFGIQVGDLITNTTDEQNQTVWRVTRIEEWQNEGVYFWGDYVRGTYYGQKVTAPSFKKFHGMLTEDNYRKVER